MTSKPDDDRTARIRDLNDRLRQAGPVSSEGRWLLTRGVSAQGATFTALAAISVQRFASFDHDNDPWNEHDFGAFELLNQRLFWKIDYYDRDCVTGSPDPADPAVTTRVLTIMLADEY